MTKRGHAHADHVGCSQVIAYLWAARACGPSMSPLTPILTFVSSTMLEGTLRPVSSLFCRLSCSFPFHLIPGSYRFIPLFAFKRGNDRLNTRFNTYLPDDTLSAPCQRSAFSTMVLFSLFFSFDNF